MNRWFGKRYPAEAYTDCPFVATPVGAECARCSEKIEANDDGWQYSNGPYAHRECYMRGIIGNIIHQLRMCSCFHPAMIEFEPNKYDRYWVALDDRSITCFRCGMTSYSRDDVRFRYCGNCCIYHDNQPPLTLREEAKGAVAFYYRNRSCQ